MKTEIGNTTKAFGREYNISVTNYSGDDLMKSYDLLQENTLIVSSKVDDNLKDVGSYAVFMTDANGYPVRLTYTIQPGNGLHVDPNDTDIIRMVIDENSIMEEGDEIYVNKHNIIDNNTLTVNPSAGDNSKRGRIGVVTANLDKGTSMNYGITKGDEVTTYIDPSTPGILSVNTQNLETIDDASNRDGIVRHSSEMWRTIKAEDGKLTVLTQNLDKATSESFGVVKTDDKTIIADDNGTISVMTAGLDTANEYRYGIVKGDETTTHIEDGIITVNSRNLQPATEDSLGVIMADKYSLTVDSTGLLSVNRFSEIEAILETNNPEHAIFRDDIEDLKNRVSKLETAAQQELIEFLIPANDPETVLPVPVYNPETKSTNHYAERKTISFNIKSNCKFNVNVEYKDNTNNYSQVTLISVKYGDNINIPANQLANTVFDETGQTIKTLNFTFAVKNYEKDDNFASINTQVIISAASINDAAIKQTSFHIFKCWNNFAFNEDDKPALQIPNEPVLNTQSYWLYTNGSERIKIYGNSTKTTAVDMNGTTTGNFYFNTEILGTYMYYNVFNNTWQKYDTSKYLLTSAVSGKNVKIECFEDSECRNSANFITASISSNYNTTKQYDVLSVKTTKGITSSNRTAYIRVSVINSIPEVTTVSSAIDGGARYTRITNNDTISVNSNNAINTAYSNIITIKNELMSTAAVASALKYERNVISQANENTTLLTSAVSKPIFYNIVNEDIAAFEAAYTEIKNYVLIDTGADTIKVPNNTDPMYIKYWDCINLMNTYGSKIANEYKNFITSYNTISSTLNDNLNKDKSILFIYQENANVVQPIINVTSNISGNGSNGITFAFSRNKQSIVQDSQYHVDIKYNFINKNGELVNSEGDNQNVTEYNVALYPGSNTEYTYVQKNNDIISAGSGFTTSTTTQDIYYNVVAISGAFKNNGSLWGIGSGHKDEGIAYFGGYNPNTGSFITSISDDIYGVYYFDGQDAKTKHYWTMPLRYKANGYSQALVQSSDADKKGQFVGLTKTNYASNGSTVNQSSLWIIVNGTKYITKKAAGQAKNECTQSASAEQTALKNLAKTYYNNNKTNLVADTNNVPISIANNIVGIKIKSVTVSPGAFDMEPKVTFSSSGSWTHSTPPAGNSSSSGSGSGSSNTNYTFGNAKITNMNVEAWDDYSMSISFTITGGSTTNLPNNANVIEVTSTSNGRTNFVFIQDGKTFNYTNFYRTYSFTSTKWVNNSCTVTYKLFNPYSYSDNGYYVTRVSFYNKSTRMLDTVYLDMVPIGIDKYYASNYDRYTNEPFIPYMTGMKFWIGINIAGSYNVSKRFESSTSSLGNEVSQPMPYMQMTSKNLNIVNALV